ncbi:MAG: hypothetical protein WC408_02970 [Candidatus Micrarchaeia archaeon]|jgi:hypothetical protein
MELVSLKGAPKEAKVAILRELGYDSDGTFVTDSTGVRVKDRYIDIEIELANMLVVPGSTIILDNNPLSVAAYLEDHENAL